MKANRIMHKGIVLLTALAVLLCVVPASALTATAPAADEAFSFRNGITWDTTVDEMLAAEGVESEEDYEYYDTGYTEMYSLEIDMDDTYMQVGYGFVDGLLLFAAEYYEDEPTENYDQHLAELTALYGQPTETDAQNAAPLFKAIGTEDLDDGLSAIAGWTLANGTRVYLMVMYDEIYTFYYNMDRLEIAEEDEAKGEAVQPPTVSTGTFAIRNGVTWDTTVDEMLAAEGALSEDDYELSDAGDYTGYVFNPDDEGTSIAYAFDEDQLMMVAEYYRSAPVEDYDVRLGELTTLYGAPSETDATHAKELFNAFEFGSLDEGLTAISGWVLSDGTAVYLMIMYDEVYLFYFNETMMWE